MHHSSRAEHGLRRGRFPELAAIVGSHLTVSAGGQTEAGALLYLRENRSRQTGDWVEPI